MKYRLFYCCIISMIITVLHAEDTVFFKNYLSSIPETSYQKLCTLLENRPVKYNNIMKSIAITTAPALFKAYPQLCSNCAYVPLGTLPTPIVHLKQLGVYMNHKHLYMKRDDLTGYTQGNQRQLFGGNKVRKLEFLLADALAHNFDTVITFGGAGSNHALCTAVYAQQCGLRCSLLLSPQSSSNTVRRNLLLDHYHQAITREYPHSLLRETALFNQIVDNYLTTENVPYIIPVGGSNALGTLGFVNAAFELKQQVEQGLLPEPDYIYIPFGSMGTTAGLLLGLCVTGLKTKIRAIKVTPTVRFNKETLYQLAQDANALLHKYNSSFPLVELPEDRVEISYDFIGPDYGIPTDATHAAIDTFKNTENIVLDVTYTGKTMEMLLHDIITNTINKNDIVLFWNTYCGASFEHITAHMDYTELPQCFHKHFEQASEIN